MATYKYTLTNMDGAGNAYVRFNISPDFGTPIAPGESFTITGQFMHKGTRSYGVRCILGVDADIYGFLKSGVEIGSAFTGAVNSGRVGSFTINGTMPDAVFALDKSENRLFLPYLTFDIITSEDGSGSSGMFVDEACKVAALKTRLAPVIDGVEWDDETRALARFGNYVQGFSIPKISIAETLDPLDSTVEIVTRSLTVGGKAYDLKSAAEAIDVINQSGDVPWALAVTDNKGNSAIATGERYVFPYHVPRLNAFAVERYRERITDEGETQYIPADDGDHVWISIDADIKSVDGKNAWTAELDWSDGAAMQITPILSGEDGQRIVYDKDRGLFTARVEITKNYTFALVISDWFTAEKGEVVTLVCEVAKAESFMHVGKYGVAIGMYSTGTEERKKFEIAEDYEFIHYGHSDYRDGEVKTGETWMNGKSVYRYVVDTATTTDGGEGTIGTLPAPVDTLVRIWGSLRQENGTWTGLPHVYYGSERWTAGLVIDPSGDIKIQLGSDYNGEKRVIVVVEYTKAEA